MADEPAEVVVGLAGLAAELGAGGGCHLVGSCEAHSAVRLRSCWW